MAKPPTSTRTVRLTDELWATIKADAEARGEAVNAAIARHLRIAYTPKDKLTVERIVDETIASPTGQRVAEKLRTIKPRPSGSMTMEIEGYGTVHGVSGLPAAAPSKHVNRLKGTWKPR